METRKIQQVGGGTYTVSLPKEWATDAEIEPGSLVALHTHIDGTLVIRTDGNECEGPQPLALSVETAAPAAVARTLRAAYTAGMETVDLRIADGVDEQTHQRVDAVTRTLTGFTVTETTSDTVQVRSLLDAEEVSITQSVRQLQFAALSAHRNATTALQRAEAAERSDDRDNQTTRIFAMVDRYFQLGLNSLTVMDALGLTRPELFLRWITARELERVADEARRIAAVAEQLESTADGDFIDQLSDLAEDVRALVRAAVSVVVDDAAAAAIQRVLDEADRIRRAVQSLDRQLFETDGANYRLTRVLDSLERTADSAGTIARHALRSRLRASCRSETPLSVGGNAGEQSGSMTDTGQ